MYTVCQRCREVYELDDLTRGFCDQCLEDLKLIAKKLTRNERLQLAADAGFDTWDDYNGER